MVGVVVALTLPGLLIVLFVLAVVDHALIRLGRHGVVPWRRDRPVTSTGFDLLQVALSPGKEYELDRRQTELLVRADEEDGAPPRGGLDLDSGVARLRLP